MNSQKQELPICEYHLPTWMFTEFGVVRLWKCGFTVLLYTTDRKFEKSVNVNITNEESEALNNFLKNYPAKSDIVNIDQVMNIPIDSAYTQQRFLAIHGFINQADNYERENK